ncbi:RNA polymerase sigma factor [Radiobacillus deserti]|uniref:RNA polymerase sigma factor n=1 Tax=Radiobacillus deserti TaxID=2594883 RepID=A0A516KDF1_9BACI|nr:RNA polymerase sigma factor [Radiobacillus deserti]QDP39400.1 RNA polymerase sigma factor [Radiobacillus deserti]
MEKLLNNLEGNLIQKTRDVKKDFDQIVSEYATDLWNFCRYLTGSPWDGEDLYQETLIKSFGILPLRWSEITDKKYYLFRIATNTWLDQCKKQKRVVGTLDDVPEPKVHFSDQLLLEEILISLEENLSPKQLAAFLLFDVFQFSAEEVAGIVRSTPGGVYANVQRTRKKITSIEPKSKPTSLPPTSPIIQAYLDAFNKGDLDQLLALISEQADNEAFLGFQEYSKDEMRKGSLRYGLPGNYAKEVILWGRPVIVVLTKEDNELHDIQYQEVENDQIVSHKSYFFRKELIFAAAKELGLKVQLVKPPVDWS